MYVLVMQRLGLSSIAKWHAPEADSKNELSIPIPRIDIRESNLELVLVRALEFEAQKFVHDDAFGEVVQCVLRRLFFRRCETRLESEEREKKKKRMK